MKSESGIVPPKRVRHIVRILQGGCMTCNGSLAMWVGPHAQAVAARHHDATRHQTWCDVTLSYVYGADAKDDRQIDIEDAIAQASQ